VRIENMSIRVSEADKGYPEGVFDLIAQGDR
jgi:hypothetical protein